MKLVLLHGLGQQADAWEQVRRGLGSIPSEAIDLLVEGQFPESFETMTNRLIQELEEQEEDVVVVGLSGGNGRRCFARSNHSLFERSCPCCRARLSQRESFLAFAKGSLFSASSYFFPKTGIGQAQYF